MKRQCPDDYGDYAGLGVPWVIAATYYEVQGKTYDTPAGPLSFSVMIFMVRC
jgi:hypothetical protein